MSRKSISPEVQKTILIKSRRRCCLCFYLEEDDSEKKGQIAHLDKDNTNNKEGNLAFLCLHHHDSYDSKSSQSKNYTLKEVRQYRDDLYNNYINVSYDNKYILNNTTQGDKSDYKKWLEGYKMKGGNVSQYKKEIFRRFRIVNSKLMLKPLYGSLSVEFLVVEGGEIEFISDGIGHSKIYYMIDYKYSGTGIPEDI